MGRERFLFLPCPPPCGFALWGPDLSGRKSRRYSPDCLEKLSDKSLEGFRSFGLAVPKAANWCFWARFDHSQECRSGPFRKLSDSF